LCGSLNVYGILLVLLESLRFTTFMRISIQSLNHAEYFNIRVWTCITVPIKWQHIFHCSQ